MKFAPLLLRRAKRGAVSDGRAPATALLVPALQVLVLEMRTLVHLAYLDGIRVGLRLEDDAQHDEFTAHVLHGEWGPIREVSEYTRCVQQLVGDRLEPSLHTIQTWEGLTMDDLLNTKETVPQ
jgi:hypothetical protein